MRGIVPLGSLEVPEGCNTIELNCVAPAFRRAAWIHAGARLKAGAT